MKLFSVIVPVYTAEQTIERCINSILKQTVEDFELILIDDGSADSSFSICQDSAQQDSRIILFSQSNKGVSSARNKGIELSSGDYLVFVDSDDYVDSDYLSAFMTDDHADLIVGGYILEDMDGNSKKIISYPDETILIEKDYAALCRPFVEGRLNTVWGKSIRRSLILDGNVIFCEGMDMGEDTLFVVQLLKQVSLIKFIERSKYHYVVRKNGSLTSNFNDTVLIDKLETVYSRIASKLSDMTGQVTAQRWVSVRLGQIYKPILNVSLSNYFAKRGIVKHLYMQTWFLNSLDFVDELYADESEKYKTILKTKSFHIMDLYVKYKKFMNK